MTLFLASFDLDVRDYPDRDSVQRGLVRLIEAESEIEAREKLEAHYKARSSYYCVHYSVDLKEINEVIR